MSKKFMFICFGVFVSLVFVGYGCSDSAGTASIGIPDPSLTCGGSACVQ